MESNKKSQEEEVRTGNAEDPSSSKKSFKFIPFAPVKPATVKYKNNCRINDDCSQMFSRSYEPPIKVEKCAIGVNHLNHFFIRYGQYGHVLWNDARLKECSSVFFFGPRIDKNAQWSPLGTFLATPGRKMTTLWGDARGRYSLVLPLMHYHHAKVEQVSFSPAEKYLVSYSKPSNPLEHWLKIFHVSTGNEFLALDGQALTAQDVTWPVIRWAGGKDDKYFAMFYQDTVSVYELGTYPNSVKTVMTFDNVLDMSWSPCESTLALLKEKGKVFLVQFPEKHELAHTDLPSFNNNCNMYWQSNGKYLAVQNDQDTSSELVLFCLSDDACTCTNMHIIKVPTKIVAFAWQPRGHMFAVIHGNKRFPDVSFYCMLSSPTVPKHTFKTNANALFWSPRGNIIVLAGLKGFFGGQLEFFDVDAFVSLNKVKHSNVTNISWDATGKYVVSTKMMKMEPGFLEKMDTSKKNWGFKKMETGKNNGFMMWFCDGKHLYSSEYGKCPMLQLDWRPYGGKEVIDTMLLDKVKVSPFDPERFAIAKLSNRMTTRPTRLAKRKLDNLASEEEG